MTTSKAVETQGGNDEPLIVIASNRGPFSFKAQKDGTYITKRSPGGLATALAALAASRDVLWVAAALSKGDHQWAEEHNDEPQEVGGIQLKFVRPTKKAYERYYNVISNPLLWFIQHQLWDYPRKPSITSETWKAWERGYVAINQLFAETIADLVEHVNRPVIILPQDYHLYMMPQFLRDRLGFNVQIQPFVHIPWPSPDAWRILPLEMRNRILISLLQSDRVGFQTKRDGFNFVQTCRFYLQDAHSHGSRDSIHFEGRKVSAPSYPISVDVKALETMMEEPETKMFREQIRNFVMGHQVILRIDRVEPSKNILRGLEAFRTLLERHPEHVNHVQMLALLVPSRMEVDEYQSYLQEIMAIAGMINAEYGDGDWEPVRILLGNNYRRAMAAMQLYDVLLVNPIADGMNLVAKEGALVNQNDGVIVLSEHAGAFYELGDHVLSVSPFDIFSTAEALHQGLTMTLSERRERAEALRAKVQKNDVQRWFYDQVEDALEALSSQDKNDSTSETPEAIKSALS
ncbi:MAG: trehalose-6-phosphate synthase [Anaerolineae bacterium]|nr:trehalose-6-phosphate synthase [Anaerolineae bacterium]